MKYVTVNRDTSDFQKPLEDQQLIALCRHALGPEHLPRQWQWLSSGKFNTSYRIEFDSHPAVILRVAPPTDAIIFRHERQLLQREAEVQQQLCTVSDTIPKNLLADFSRTLIDRDYVFQPCLPGQLWESVKDELSAAENYALWQQFGTIVKGIHNISSKQFGYPGPAQSFAHWGEAMHHWVAGMIQDMQHYQLPSDDAKHFLTLLEQHQPLLDEVTQPTLVHGDLWLKNILIERHQGSAKISAVLDAERAFWGEPAAEWIFSFFDIPEAFWQSYGALPTDSSSIIRNNIYEGRGAIQLCLEAWRFHFDDSFARRILQLAITALDQ